MESEGRDGTEGEEKGREGKRGVSKGNKRREKKGMEKMR